MPSGSCHLIPFMCLSNSITLNRAPFAFAIATAMVVLSGAPGNAASSAAAGRTLPGIDPSRVSQITTWLVPDPVHFAPSFDDRAFWGALANLPAAGSLLAVARKATREPVPELTDALYSEFKKTGNRNSYERPANQRTERLAALVLAEGLIGNGTNRRWLAPIETELAAILDEPTWAVPAHIRSRKTRADAYDYVDLAAAARAWTLATADWLLGDRLQPATRERIRREIRARVVAPWLERVRTRDVRDFWWMNVDHNWNAVCNAGVVGAALILAESPGERATLIAAYEALTPYYINGFANDGFCHEGLGYWSYGFGHYLLGGELIRLNTNGRVDLLAEPKVVRIASFARNWEIANGIYAAFGDAWTHSTVASWSAPFIAARFGADAAPNAENTVDFLQRHNLGAQLYRSLFCLSYPIKIRKPHALALRNWFPDGGALVARSNPATAGLSVALKGGHNGQAHNHNDLGSFVVVHDGSLVLSDLGADDYVKDTFGPLRYTSGVMNSFGHPVPRVAGQLQRTGADAIAISVRADFTSESDIWSMDLTSAYDVPALDRLTRTFTFVRAGGGRLEIVDRVRFSTPQTFGNAVILLPGQQWNSTHEAGFRVKSDDKTVDITFHASGGDIVLNEEPVHGIVPDSPPKGIRVGLDLRHPAREAEIRLVITPSMVESHP